MVGHEPHEGEQQGMTIANLGIEQLGAAPRGAALSRNHIVGGRSPSAMEVCDASRDLAQLDRTHAWWEESTVDEHIVHDVLQRHGVTMAWDDVCAMCEQWPARGHAQEADIREWLCRCGVLDAE